MKQMYAKAVKCLPLKARCFCSDNSGAKEIEIISVYKIKTKWRQTPTAGIGSLVNVVVKKGKPSIKKKVEKAVVVRVRKAYRRKTGARISFEDNAVVVLKDDKGNPKGTIFKGPIAKEVANKWPAVAKVASMII